MTTTESSMNTYGQPKAGNTYIKPATQRQAVVPISFRNAVLLHIVKNYIPGLESPLMLAIQGDKGEGKTFQAREVCSQMGVYLVPLSGALLSGPHENSAVEVLKQTYHYANSVRTSFQKMTAIVIDDFDLSVASIFEDRKYTVNTQLLTGFLMNLADDPTRCGDKKTSRIPIIMTGNNFTALHAPLVRHGRMNFFEWQPSFEEKVEVVSSILKPLLHSEEVAKVRSLLQSFPNQSIAFFSSLRNDLVDEMILQKIVQDQEVDLTVIAEVVMGTMQNQTVEVLHRLAKKRNERNAQDYLVHPNRISSKLRFGRNR